MGHKGEHRPLARAQHGKMEHRCKQAVDSALCRAVELQHTELRLLPLVDRVQKQLSDETWVRRAFCLAHHLPE